MFTCISNCPGFDSTIPLQKGFTRVIRIIFFQTEFKFLLGEEGGPTGNIFTPDSGRSSSPSDIIGIPVEPEEMMEIMKSFQVLELVSFEQNGSLDSFSPTTNETKDVAPISLQSIKEEGAEDETSDQDR